LAPLFNITMIEPITSRWLEQHESLKKLNIWFLIKTEDEWLIETLAHSLIF